MDTKEVRTSNKASNKSEKSHVDFNKSEVTLELEKAQKTVDAWNEKAEAYGLLIASDAKSKAKAEERLKMLQALAEAEKPQQFFYIGGKAHLKEERAITAQATAKKYQSLSVLDLFPELAQQSSKVKKEICRIASGVKGEALDIKLENGEVIFKLKDGDENFKAFIIPLK